MNELKHLKNFMRKVSIFFNAYRDYAYTYFHGITSEHYFFLILNRRKRVL
jgi:hypothetical protein